jgi:hypothetical protein
VAFGGEVVIIAIVLLGSRLVHDVPYTGSRGVDVVGAILSALGMGGVVLGILVWEEGGEAVGALIAVGVVALGSLVWWLVRRKREGKPALLDVGLFASKYFRLGISSQTLQQIALGGMMISLPIYLQMVLEYNAMEAGLSLAPLSLSMFAVALLAGRKAGDRSPSKIILAGFLLLAAGLLVLIPIVPRADSGWWMVVPLLIAGCGLGLLVSQLNNYTLSPIEEERVSEAAGVNSAGGLLRARLRPRVRRRDPARVAVARVHALLGLEQGALAGRATASLGRAREKRRGDDQHAPRGAVGRAADRRSGGDHPHQHRGEAEGAADRPAGAAHRGPARPSERVPHDPLAGPGALGRRRRGDRRVSA